MSGKRYLCIKNFDEQQHYKDRNPIWIKLPCALLDDYRFATIPDDAKFHAVGLMLLASRLDNKFPDDERWLRRKINAETEINIKLLLAIGFLEVVKDKKQVEKKPTMTCKSMKTQGESASTTFEDENYCASTTFNAAENCASTEQNRTEENRKEHNTTDKTLAADATDAPQEESSVVVCDFQNPSKTSSEEISNNESRGEKVNNNDSRDEELSNEESRREESAGKKEPYLARSHLSEFSLEECLRYVERCRLEGQNIANPRGLATTLYKSGSADAFIRATLYPVKQQEIDREQFGEPVQFSGEPCSICYGVKMSNVDGKGFRHCEHCRNERGKSTGLEPKRESNE